MRDGGALLVVDNDDDPYNAVREWWNTAPNSYKTPREHLFAQLGIPEDGAGLFHVGRGVVLSERISPAALTYEADGGDTLRKFAEQAAAAVHLPWSETNALVLRRGPYVIAAGLDDSIPNAAPVTLHGRYLNLFDANLPVLKNVTVEPGMRALLYDLDFNQGTSPRVVAAACRVHDESFGGNKLSFSADGIADTTAAVRIETGRKPVSVSVGGMKIEAGSSKTVEPGQYEMDGGTLLLRFVNSIDPIPVSIQF